MNRFLSFRNKTLEQEFVGRHDLSLNKSEVLIKMLLICYCVTYTARYIFDYIFSPGYTLKTMFIAIGIIYGTVSVYFIGRFLFKRWRVQASTADITVLVLSILALVLMNNPIRSPKDNCDPSYVCFWDCYEIGIFNLVMVQVMRRWYHKAIYYAFNCTYFLVWKQATIYDHLMAIKIVGFIFMTTCLFYFREKGARYDFLEKHHQDISTKHILKALPEGILILDDTFSCHHSNPSIEKMFPELNVSDKQSVVAFTRSILHPKPRNLYSDFKSTLFERVFMPQENGKNTAAAGGGLTHLNSMEDLLISPHHANGHNLSDLENNRPLVKGNNHHHPHKPSDGGGNLLSVDGSQDPSRIPTATAEVPVFKSLYSYLLSFFDAFQEVESLKYNYEDILEHFYFDVKHETKALEISISSINFINKRCFLLIFRDKTYSDLITELENSSKYKSLVLATVSHELRTPVNSTLHLLNSVIECQDVPEPCLENYIKPAKKVLVMMLNLINDILDYSSFNEDKLKLVFQPVDIKAVVTEALGLIEIQSKRKGIYLKLDLDNSIPPLFETDPNRLTQVLLNLLSNAYKFTSKGGITVSAHMVENDHSMTLLKICVKDTGIGIKKEDVDKLFVGYEKIDLGADQKMNPNGCGLGLSIANKLAKYLSRENFGGLKVESEVGKGTTFSFILENKRRRGRSLHGGGLYRKASSYRKSSEKSSTVANRKATYFDVSLRNILEIQEGEESVCHKVLKKAFLNYEQPSSQRVTCDVDYCNFEQFIFEENQYRCICPSILIVDDDAFNQLTLENLLRKLNYTSKSCFNGEQAIEEVIRRETQKDCGEYCMNYLAIFMDCNMPIKDGFEATKEIKQYLRENDMPMIPIIGLSAHSDEIGAPTAIAAGMDFYLTKPTTKDKLEYLLNQIQNEGSE